MPENSGGSLTAVAHEVNTEEASLVAEKYFGIKGQIRRLISERDHNFHIQDGDSGYVLKIAHPAEDLLVSNFQTEALLHLERSDSTLPVQRVVRTLSGATDLRLDFSGQMRTVRMVTFLEGMLLRNAPVTAHQQFNLGVVAAQLTLALADFNHPAADHVLLWDIQHLDKLSEMLDVFQPDKRAVLQDYLDLFNNVVRPAYKNVRVQVVHNDLNSDNALVNPQNTDEVAAVLDFGDMVRTPLINDVAVGMTYQLGEGRELLVGANAFLKGYLSKAPLQEKELDLLADLILLRMVLRITITEWRASKFPENRDYILRNTAKSWIQFEQLRSLGRHQIEEGIFAGVKSVNEFVSV
ncbi:phosphotransferase [Pseudomonas putida]|uniref:phosphotransferase n=1 Tax=Pseudomonas putida TaxID=303 RepID=UPI0023643FD7|nr:phosphotransferase [Pseudomonas putida]MDD2002092.1 phosphotransferase [Pseudomonas putida]